MACVLAGVDFSDVTQRVLETAGRLARALDAELVVLHVAAPEPEFVGFAAGPQSVRDQVAEKLREQHRELGTCVETLVAHGTKARALMVQGAAAEALLEHATRLGAELIVVGSHGHGKLHQLLTGSVAGAVLKRASVPVIMVPARGA
jgi:nucleotide-binding universal stress UspA family protein